MIKFWKNWPIRFYKPKTKKIKKIEPELGKKPKKPSQTGLNRFCAKKPNQNWSVWTGVGFFKKKIQFDCCFFLNRTEQKIKILVRQQWTLSWGQNDNWETPLIKFPSLSFISQTCNNLYQNKPFSQYWVYKVYKATCKSSFNKVYKVTLTKFSVKLNLQWLLQIFLIYSVFKNPWKSFGDIESMRALTNIFYF